VNLKFKVLDVIDIGVSRFIIPTSLVIPVQPLLPPAKSPAPLFLSKALSVKYASIVPLDAVAPEYVPSHALLAPKVFM